MHHSPPTAGRTQTTAGTAASAPDAFTVYPVTASGPMSAARAGNEGPVSPSGPRTRRVTASAYGIPVTSAMSWPSTA